MFLLLPSTVEFQLLPLSKLAQIPPDRRVPVRPPVYAKGYRPITCHYTDANLLKLMSYRIRACRFLALQLKVIKAKLALWATQPDISGGLGKLGQSARLHCAARNGGRISSLSQHRSHGHHYGTPCVRPPCAWLRTGCSFLCVKVEASAPCGARKC